MTEPVSGWEEFQRRRWMRHDAHRWVRQDADRWLRPGFEPALPSLDRKYNPDQPRVPAGSSHGGRWTAEQGSNRVRLAGNGRPPIGRSAMLAIVAELAMQAIKNFRSENYLVDLFGRDDGTVAVTTIDNKDIFGVNGKSINFDGEDRRAANALRESLLQKYPDALSVDNVGQRPNGAIFHAETTTLLRAARVSGGSLVGRKLEIFVDRPMCPSCDGLLPLIGLEVGNPTVTFVGPGRTLKIMRDGKWIK